MEPTAASRRIDVPTIAATDRVPAVAAMGAGVAFLPELSRETSAATTSSSPQLAERRTDKLHMGMEGEEAFRDLESEVLAGLEYPDFEQDYELVALRHESEYAINEGRLVSNRGLDIPINEYNEHFEEIHVEHSNALHGLHRKRGSYFVGPLARYTLNADQLSPVAQQAAIDAGLGETCNNPFKSILVRAVELVYACDEALRIINDIDLPDKPAIDVPIRAGVGDGCTEAPRGILYHRYEIDDAGKILRAQIVPPTSQNQPSIEADLGAFVQQNLALGKNDLQWRCEQAIRNYGPCISCATHFLELDIVEE